MSINDDDDADADEGCFIIDFPGLTKEQVWQALHSQCPHCGCAFDTHLLSCPLQKREPIILKFKTRD